MTRDALLWGSDRAGHVAWTVRGAVVIAPATNLEDDDADL